jgi:hypothetical protein
VWRKVKALTIFFLAFLLFRCGEQPQPIPGLWNVPIQTSTPLPPTATPNPGFVPQVEPPIVITPVAGAAPDAEAFFNLTIAVIDGYGLAQEALVTISWPDDATSFVIGPTAEMRLPLQMRSPSFLVTVEKEGYRTVYQPFNVILSGDMDYQLTVILFPAGAIA